MTVLRHFLDAGRNKSKAAAGCGLSRPAFYERLNTIEEVIGASLDDTPTCLTLQVAIAALDAVRSPG